LISSEEHEEGDPGFKGAAGDDVADGNEARLPVSAECYPTCPPPCGLLCEMAVVPSRGL